VKDEFSFEAKIYDRVWGKYEYDRDVEFLDSLFRKHKCRSVIDIGCGTGNHSIRLSNLGYQVTGVDVSPAMLKIARNKGKKAKITFMLGDMRKLGKDFSKSQKFDAAICLGQVFHHLVNRNDLPTFLEELHKILRRNGLFVFCTRNAKKIKDEYLNTLRLDHMVNEEKLQLAIFSYNSRDLEDPNILVWRTIYILKEDDKVDFQIREHRLRWFEFSPLKQIIRENRFKIITTYSGPQREKFTENDHQDMWFVTTAT
jgi:SAM-dependent methyltransferase